MVMRPFDNHVLDGLCSKDQLDLLDSVDRLRSQGIDHYVSLPQIIVCGDQSSGKSSVLEAISGVSFPVKSNLCTRFPTELILRKTANVGVNVSIVPDQSHSEAERASLGEFRETLDDFDALPKLIDTAKTFMAIGSYGRAFSRDLLRIEISGPDRPHLTIVDLPGLIHSETKQQSAADVELVQDVVNSYMKEPRSIILAVVSAKNDYANQIVLKLARAADRDGTRTLGVITKPDTLIPASDSESMYVTLAQNLDVEFRLGWHVLRNMDSETGPWSLSTRDEEEKLFFADGVWPTLPHHILGITPLRERLSKLLLGQIAAELPSLIEEIEAKSTACRAQLQKLGQPRASIEEQRLYLLTLGQTFQSLTKAAVDGTYNHDFFGDAKTDAGYQKRIRAVVQNLNQSFAHSMARKGHQYTITDSPTDSSARNGSSKVQIITRATYLNRIETLMKRTRGRELPGTFNPMIISDLFLEQSQPWEALAKSHIGQVARAVKDFLRQLVWFVADTSTCDALFEILVEPALTDIVKDLKDKTTDLLAPHQRGHPITYNHYFTETIQNVKKQRARTDFTRIIQNFFNVQSLSPTGLPQSMDMDYRPLLEALMTHNNPDMNQYACSEALDCMQAYYKVAFKRFVDDIAIEAVETNIIARLDNILAPIKIACLSNEVITSVAGESEESRFQRKQLTNQLSVLVQGLGTCKRFVGRTLRGTRRLSLPLDRAEPPSRDISLDLHGTELNDPYDDMDEVGSLVEEQFDVSAPAEPVLEPEVTPVPEPVDSCGPPATITIKKKIKKRKVPRAISPPPPPPPEEPPLSPSWS
ncbi:P-loop containing nucleoside triphosphate hydrolase protein [Phaeosphaeria sp. MPI-PUGE-AT-0046c]|nr:P-loop containing nucleoside triphosphate hydrolase protein [Phaeosphaeria sp. MPI-PUGE-AT-0046c]